MNAELLQRLLPKITPKYSDPMWLTSAEFDEIRRDACHPYARACESRLFGRRILIIDRFHQDGGEG